jgi:hypothetical protein
MILKFCNQRFGSNLKYCLIFYSYGKVNVWWRIYCKFLIFILKYLHTLKYNWTLSTSFYLNQCTSLCDLDVYPYGFPNLIQWMFFPNRLLVHIVLTFFSCSRCSLVCRKRKQQENGMVLKHSNDPSKVHHLRVTECQYLWYVFDDVKMCSGFALIWENYDLTLFDVLRHSKFPEWTILRIDRKGLTYYSSRGIDIHEKKGRILLITSLHVAEKCELASLNRHFHD